MNLNTILNNDFSSILKSHKFTSLNETTPSEQAKVYQLPCYFSQEQLDLYKKVIQLHYSDILQLINNDSKDMSDYIKNSMDLLAINLESVSIHPYVLIMSKLPNSNRQLVFKEFVKTQLLTNSGKLYALKMLIENIKESKIKKNVVVYFRGDFNINNLYDFEDTRYKHLSYIPGDILQEIQLRRNTVSDIQLGEIKSEDPNDEESDLENLAKSNIDETMNPTNVKENSRDDSNDSDSGEDANKKKEKNFKASNPKSIEEDSIQSSIGGRSKSTLSSTTQPTRICDILEAILTANLSPKNTSKINVQRYDGKKRLKRDIKSPTTADTSSNDNENRGVNGKKNNGSKDELTVHLVSNMEVECPVETADLVITLDSCSPPKGFIPLQNVDTIALFTPYSIDYFLRLKHLDSSIGVKDVIMDVICNRDRAGTLNDSWISEYLNGLQNVLPLQNNSIFKNEEYFSFKKYTRGTKQLTEQILEYSDDLYGDFLENYVNGLDSGDSVFNFLRYLKHIDHRINFSELSDSDIINIRKLVKERIHLKDDDTLLNEDTFKITKNLIVNFDQRILYQLSRGLKSFKNKEIKREISNEEIFEKLQNQKELKKYAEGLNKYIDNEIAFFNSEYDFLVKKIVVDGIKYTKESNEKIEQGLHKQKQLREEISKFKEELNKKEITNNNQENEITHLKKKINDKFKEIEYLSSEIEKAEKSVVDSNNEISTIQKKLESVESEVESKMSFITFKKRELSEMLNSDEVRKTKEVIEESNSFFTLVSELPSKRSKRQRRR
ncbi:uncharacterized protein HGUI_03105 [Hanseniaspora guilliermondii]|uniref:HDA1 complex subunit 2 n=1 Tax=Hanseniaspora guilliermondii TaxID=56406 RepID=A0A1L0CQW3_9ASCO|nr:uncharacterized protein HGUI_03105 [Hanseniaspora guilliermondii]